MLFRRLATLVLLASASAHCQPAPLPPAGAAGALRAAYQDLAWDLANNPFRRPLHIASTEASGAWAGDLHAVVPHRFADVEAALGAPAYWCEVLILHINTKYCRADGATLAVQIGTKSPQALDPAALVRFSFRRAAAGADYFLVELGAGQGPMGTRNYRLRLEAMPLPGGATFLHFSYAYEAGLVGNIAMQAYLATAGRGKVGFTSTGVSAEGRPVYIDGVRGVVERNAMRYYLAIDAFIESRAAPAAEQFERRLDTWFRSTEEYQRQLHDVDRDTYVAMKRDEYRRQQPERAPPQEATRLTPARFRPRRARDAPVPG
jgi:hypothetical protein